MRQHLKHHNEGLAAEWRWSRCQEELNVRKQSMAGNLPQPVGIGVEAVDDPGEGNARVFHALFVIVAGDALAQ